MSTIPEVPAVEPGKTTTEFFVAAFANLANAVVTLLAMFKLKVDADYLQGLIVAASNVASGAVSLFYIRARAAVKVAASAARNVTSTLDKQIDGVLAMFEKDQIDGAQLKTMIEQLRKNNYLF